MVLRWQHQRNECGGYGTRMHSVDFGCSPRYEEFSVIRRRALLRWCGAQKNGLRRVVACNRAGTTAGCGGCAICRAGSWRIYLELEVRRLWCRSCGSVKREWLEFLTDTALHTKRFASQVGRRCRNSTIKEVAEELHLDWHSVKELDKQYMRAQLARAGIPAPKVIGIDEISVRKRHTYRIVVSDLIRGRAIWFGGKDRSRPV